MAAELVWMMVVEKVEKRAAWMDETMVAMLATQMDYLKVAKKVGMMVDWMVLKKVETKALQTAEKKAA
jgi:hypothetical protein